LLASGGVLGALARATTAEQVVNVILDRADAMQSLSQELPAPAMRVVERIVAMRADQGDAGPDTTTVTTTRRRSRRAASRPSPVFIGRSLSSASSSNGVGASKVAGLAGKLMNLIHLAENDRRREARAEVRMADDSASARSEGQGGPSGGGGDDQVSIQLLKREVLARVLKELETLKHLSPEGHNVSIWW
jgi:hypothetical protein